MFNIININYKNVCEIIRYDDNEEFKQNYLKLFFCYLLSIFLSYIFCIIFFLVFCTVLVSQIVSTIDRLGYTENEMINVIDKSAKVLIILNLFLPTIFRFYFYILTSQYFCKNVIKAKNAENQLLNNIEIISAVTIVNIIISIIICKFIK